LGYLSPTNLNSFVKLISFGCEHVGKTLADPKLTGSHCITADTAVLLKSKQRARSSRHYISLRDVFPAGWAWLIWGSCDLAPLCYRMVNSVHHLNGWANARIGAIDNHKRELEFSATLHISTVSRTLYAAGRTWERHTWGEVL